MNVDREKLRELRERTGQSMLECRRLLLEADGDVEWAISLMYLKGSVTCAVRWDRINLGRDTDTATDSADA